MDAMSELSSLPLHEAQRRVVEWQGGPLLVLGGPGTGKTALLARKVAQVCAQPGTQKVLGLAFSRRAAETWRQKAIELAPEVAQRALLTTCHSLACEVLREFGGRVGVRPDFSILNRPEEQQRVLQDAIAALHSAGANVEPGDIEHLPRIEVVMERLLRPDEVIAKSHNKELGAKVALLYGGYQKQLAAQNCLDYPSILVMTHHLLSAHAEVAQALRARFSHLFVDELQDMDLAQYQLIYHLSEGDQGAKLIACADEEQILFQWSGASPERLTSFSSRLRAEILRLNESFRCPPAIVEVAARLSSQIEHRTQEAPPLRSARGEPGSVRCVPLRGLPEEIATLVKEIQERPKEEHGKCFVLARTRKLLEEAARALSKGGLRVILATPKREFESPPFRWLHALLRLAHRRDDYDQVRILNRAFYELEGLHLQVEVPASGDLLDGWFQVALSKQTLEPYTRNFLLQARIDLSIPSGLSRLLQDAFAWFEDVDRRLSGLPQEEFVDFREEQRTFEELFYSAAERFGEGLTLPVLLQELDLAPKLPPLPADAVKCLTIHTAKGLEAEFVYLLGLVEGFLPSYASTKEGASPKELEEERRACLVAVTRARRELRVSYAARYFGWRKRPSRFLDEMGLVGA
jgi:DNA helicase-2/ATP-dependent DNA helicase PcrA